MRVVAAIHVTPERVIVLCQGDLTAVQGDDGADLLVVSAFTDNYVPIPGTVVGALHDAGLSVAALARDKLVDLRANFACWLSKPIDSPLPYRQILCYEPLKLGEPPELVGDIFRSLAPFAPALKRGTVTMPLVSTGNMGCHPEAILVPLVEAAVHWMSIAFPLRRLRIFVRSAESVERIQSVFEWLQARFDTAPPESCGRIEYDIFISYCHANREHVDHLYDELKTANPQLRIFRDICVLQPGMAWQSKIFEAIEVSRKVVAVISPEYLKSKMCQDEFNIAMCLHRQRGDVLYPVYLFKADLPGYMSLYQYRDCRPGDLSKLRAAAVELARL